MTTNEILKRYILQEIANRKAIDVEFGWHELHGNIISIGNCQIEYEYGCDNVDDFNIELLDYITFIANLNL